MKLYDLIVGKITGDLGIGKTLRLTLPSTLPTTGRENVVVGRKVVVVQGKEYECFFPRSDRKTLYGIKER